MTRPLSAGPPGPRGRPRKHPPKPIGRKRGGQPGNRNRRRHGAFSKCASVGRDLPKAEERRIDFVIAQVLTCHSCELAVKAMAKGLPGNAVRRPVRVDAYWRLELRRAGCAGTPRSRRSIAAMRPRNTARKRWSRPRSHCMSGSGSSGPTTIRPKVTSHFP